MRSLDLFGTESGRLTIPEPPPGTSPGEFGILDLRGRELQFPLTIFAQFYDKNMSGIGVELTFAASNRSNVSDLINPANGKLITAALSAFGSTVAVDEVCEDGDVDNRIITINGVTKAFYTAQWLIVRPLHSSGIGSASLWLSVPIIN